MLYISWGKKINKIKYNKIKKSIFNSSFNNTNDPHLQVFQIFKIRNTIRNSYNVIICNCSKLKYKYICINTENRKKIFFL